MKLSDGHIENEKCFFQVQFSVKVKDDLPCFVPYPIKGHSTNAEDVKSTELLYREFRTFAIGHGCAPYWTEDGNGRAYEIMAHVMPVYEMPSIVPMRFPDQPLKMYDMSDSSDQNKITLELWSLCNKYEDWINEQESIVNTELTEEFQATATGHIMNCRKCLLRMRDGIGLIENDPFVRRAFGLMNRAMLTQQLRYSLNLREWVADDSGASRISAIQEPDIHCPNTWPDWSVEKKANIRFGSWYPFQIAFVLMNIRSMAISNDNERKIVDLIWFPTGGGKTEAYLGLTAFTIFLRRLRNKSNSGTTVLMRYTLRLLTAQQYQRAASLICACDLIRKENETEFGKDRITLGLWVGTGLTENKRSAAVQALGKLSRGESKKNPFVILKCPWCGVEMGPIKNGGIRIKGYRKIKQPSTVIFQCDNADCQFSKLDFPLPLLVIDEDIYESPPSMIIGTIDKFALLPWRSEARSLFGFRDEVNTDPPELIIQDELHLISGPLGSIYGHYEILIHELCKRDSMEQNTGPKIIASTATITRAAQQIHALYNCGLENVFQFPVQCINAGESFFAYIDKSTRGRKYVGIHASGLSSHTFTQVRVISALLQGTKSAIVHDEKERDYYWTVINYFNSLRELGHALTLIRADIREYLNAMWMRKDIRKEGENDHRRFINKSIELTSRIPSTEIPDRLKELEIRYPIVDNNYPVDMCLATNMISVGVDVQRLGLMTVIGQPKTSSEYIQATSRVGRSKDGPGLVIVIFNTAKPRDRSHYEHFYAYHSAVYSHVEPTSVTPFSAPVRERALHAVLTGLIRYLGTNDNRLSPQPMPSKELFDRIRKIFSDRVARIDPDELELTLNLLKERENEWARHLPPKYGDFYPQTSELPLMYVAGSTPQEDWGIKSWPTLTSMRDVDVTCEADVIENYSIPGGDN